MRSASDAGTWEPESDSAGWWVRWGGETTPRRGARVVRASPGGEAKEKSVMRPRAVPSPHKRRGHKKERMNDLAKKLTYSGKGDKAKAMAPTVAEALGSFGKQNAEFAEAVEQGDFNACMDAISKGVGASISDMEIIKRAVEYYFAGAKVHFDMRIELEGEAPKAEPRKIISLEDFM